MPPAKKCPICGKPPVEKFKPFCSKRCADIDLNRWLTGSYVIPARDDEAAAGGDTDIPDADTDEDAW